MLSFSQLLTVMGLSQTLVPPSVKSNFTKLTTYQELTAYIEQLDQQSELLKVEAAGQSVKGRNLYAMKFSASQFGRDTSKIRVLIFAQQHGNEQSGKEGALLLAQELLKPENRYLFDKIELLMIPQINPDGSEVNKRRNAHGMDLNRNHLILTEPETIALHHLFDRYLFEVTMDVHEYSPYGEEWMAYGYRKNFAITLGVTTNPNVAESIRELSNKDYLPFIFRYLHDRNYSAFTYCPGGPPESAYIRHSTFDINDGRQSFGIQNTFSFIQEGMNGKDDSIENLQQRAESQMAGMRGLLEYIYGNKDRVKKLVADEREKLLQGEAGKAISIQSVHVADGRQLELPLFSCKSGKDTSVIVKDYRPVVKSLCDVTEPSGYLIPKDCTLLVEWAIRQDLLQIPLQHNSGEQIEQYMISFVDSIDFEGDIVVDPGIARSDLKEMHTEADYIYIPTNQLKGKLVVLALEPKSMLGLVTYPKYACLLRAGQPFPVLRVMKK